MFYVYIFAGIIGFFIILKQIMLFKLKKMKGKAAPRLTGKPQKAIENQKSALFYFYSPSCGACRSMTPVISQLANQNDNVFKVDITEDYDLARKFGVMATPTTILIKDKIIKDVIIGPQSTQKLKKMIE
ncbi:MAG: thioredoxin family protein [Deltaproteobacteria bacterium]|jgi:thioredoxin 1|nr:thioredoxin family protein [Deltaproteobacteria bacterium]